MRGCQCAARRQALKTLITPASPANGEKVVAVAVLRRTTVEDLAALAAAMRRKLTWRRRSK